MNGYKRTQLSGWGNYPVHPGCLFRPENTLDLQEIISNQNRFNYIPFGLGRSYGDTPLNKDGGVIAMRKMNRFLSFDENSGVLHCEAGVSLEEIIHVFLPKGYFLPTTPGTKYVTVGGAIANDVHGKNHHMDGCISEHVHEIELLLASGEIIFCSRTVHSEVFWATVGGIGLTGIILSAKVKLLPVETAFYDVSYQKANNLEKALELFSDSDDQFQYSVAWIDCLAGGNSLGRCVLMRGNHATPEHVRVSNPLSIGSKRKLSMPIYLPSFVLNRASIGLFNMGYYGINKNTRKIIDYDSFFYPLDSINNWNRMYGRNGFIQYQVVFPPETAREGLTLLLQRLNAAKQPSFLAVLKSSGEQGEGMLSFPKKGFTLALDIPVKNKELINFLGSLDELVLKYGGRLYTGKDAATTGENFALMYPRLKEFQEIKNKVDPNQLFSSSMARRLKIVEA